MTFVRWLDSILGARPDFGENVRGGGKIFRGGATMISPSRQSKNKIPYFHNFYRIMSAFYTILSSLYNCLLKLISLIILLGEVQKFLGEVLKERCKVIPGASAPPLKIRPCLGELFIFNKENVSSLSKTCP